MCKGKGLINRDDQGDYWWELRDCDYYQELEKEKIIYPDISPRLSFAYDNKYFLNNTCYFINSGSKYLLGVLNSKLIEFYYRQISSQLGKNVIRSFTIFIENIPIPFISGNNLYIKREVENLVNRVLSLSQYEGNLNNHYSKEFIHKKALIKECERKIDNLIYELYKLTEEEIKIVEEETSN